MGIEHLKDIRATVGITSTKQAIEMGRKGGKVKSMKKKYAAKIREMKKRGMNNADVDWFLQTIINPEADIIEIKKWLNELKKSPNLDEKHHNALINTAVAIHKAHYGDKIKTENVHLHINWKDILDGSEYEEKEVPHREVS